MSAARHCARPKWSRSLTSRPWTREAVVIPRDSTLHPRASFSTSSSALQNQSQAPQWPHFPPATSSSSSTNAASSSSTESFDHETRQSRTTHFGFKTVPEEAKESLVGQVFSSVASKYDLLNDSMSLGIHRAWKNAFVTSLLPRLPPSYHPATNYVTTAAGSHSSTEWKPTFQCLDVAGGTGDIALRILDRARETYGNRDVRVEIVDLNQNMLDEGRKRVATTIYYNTPQIAFTHGNAQELPKHIKDSSIDLYTIAFGIRNCTSLPAVLKEAHRVLKPGGKIGVLEFGKVTNPLFKEIYKQYSFNVIPLLGEVLAGDRDSYQYLVESIERFPTQIEFAKLMQEAGFKTGELREGAGGAWTDYTNGIATFWKGVKM